jgi:hypothetical protein
MSRESASAAARCTRNDMCSGAETISINTCIDGNVTIRTLSQLSSGGPIRLAHTGPSKTTVPPTSRIRIFMCGIYLPLYPSLPVQGSASKSLGYSALSLYFSRLIIVIGLSRGIFDRISGNAALSISTVCILLSPLFWPNLMYLELPKFVLLQCLQCIPLVVDD